MTSLMVQRFGVFKNPCPSILNLRKESFPKGFCCKFLTRSRVVVAAAAGVSTSIEDRERQNVLVLRERRKLKEMFEEACERCITSPMEGVNFTFEEFDAAVEKYDFNIEIGSKVKGTVYSVDANGALVDITAKSSGFLPLTEASIHNIKHVKEAGIFPGLVEEFVVVEENEADDGWILSLRSIQKDLAWERCTQLQAEDVIVKGKVIEANKGGVVVILECIQGFVPFSQISNKYTGDELLGKELPLKFLEMDEERGRIVLSNRNAVTDNSQAQVVVGSVITGTVQSLKPYGAFIDMGGISGLLHISQISHDRVADISTVLQPGDTLKAMVLHHDRERGRVTLSTKRLEPSPGDMIRNPKLVFEKAEEMVEKFSQRILAHANQLMPEDGLMLNSDGIFGHLNPTYR